MVLLFELFTAIIIIFLLWIYIRSKAERKFPVTNNPPQPTLDHVNILPAKIQITTEVKPPIINIPKAEVDFNLAKNLWIESIITEFAAMDSLSTLLSKKKIEEVYYGDLLSVVQWRYKRLTILVRDGFVCEDCKAGNVKNHVHHKYYLQDKLPWDIEDDALTTLCSSCHSIRHQREIINVYRLDKGQRILTSLTSKYCHRCSGAGYLPKYQHVENGICFKCRGDCVNRNIFKKAIDEYQSSIMNSSHTPIRLEYGKFLRTISIHTFIAKIYPVVNMLKSDNGNYKQSNIGIHGADEDLPF